MRIVDQKGVANALAPSTARAQAAAGSVRFTLASGASASTKAEQIAPSSILGGLEALIAIQSEDNTRERKRRSVRRGQSLLDVLDELKIGLLSGHLPVDTQTRLAVLLRDAPSSGDPRLDSIMDGIELRAAVELAKIKQSRVKPI